MTIRLADWLMNVPRGVLEDVLLKVEDFIFLVDFIVLHIEGVNIEHQTPIILYRLFVTTANVCINCRMGIVEISFGDRKVRLNVFHTAMGPTGDRCISFAYADADVDVDEATHEVSMAIFTCCIADPGPEYMFDDDTDSAVYSSSFRVLYYSIDSSFDSIDSSFDYSSDNDLVSSHPLSFEGREVDGSYIATTTNTLHRGRPRPTDLFESLLPLAMKPDSSSLESLSVIELKSLPYTLKYAYLGNDNSLPVIISSVLSSEEEKRLLAMLRGYKKAIGWKVPDLRGMDPSFCMHRIHTLEEYKNSRKIQRILNPTMKEVVKKEIIK
ncbi:unnamed protein product [Victoria cruziana]